MNAKSLHTVRISPFGGGWRRLLLCILSEKTLRAFANLAKKPCALAVKRSLFQLFSEICLYFSVKIIIFVRLCKTLKVFALFYMQFGKRKLTAGYFKLHRLLYFTRAVSLPTPAEATVPEWGLSVASGMQPSVIRYIRIITNRRNHNYDSDLWLLVGYSSPKPEQGKEREGIKSEFISEIV